MIYDRIMYLHCMKSLDIVKQYYAEFNDRNWDGMLALVADNIHHEPNQGEPREGKELFTAFLKKMEECYEETLTKLAFYVNEEDQHKIAVTFTVNGIYLKGEEGLPEAEEQAYILPASAFLTVEDGKITAIATNYNLELWIELVS